MKQDKAKDEGGRQKAVHWLGQTGIAPGQPDEFKSPCGHKSEDKKDFTSDSDKVTCEACKEKIVPRCSQGYDLRG